MKHKDGTKTQTWSNYIIGILVIVIILIIMILFVIYFSHRSSSLDIRESMSNSVKAPSTVNSNQISNGFTSIRNIDVTPPIQSLMNNQSHVYSLLDV